MNNLRTIALPLASTEDAAKVFVGRTKSLPTIRSPLRYPGGKTRAVRAIMRYLPPNLKRLCSPFLGGGSVELACAASGIRVFGADAFEPVVNFWTEALRNPVLLAQSVRKHHPMSSSEFYPLQKSYQRQQDDLERAAVFFALNRSSYSGTTLSGGMSPGCPRFTESAILRLENLQADNLSVEHADFKQTLARYEKDFLYLDPPYANGGKLYGRRGDMHEGFDHRGLADILNKRSGWVLSYNDCRMVRELYARHHIIRPQWTYGMSGDKTSKEVLIINA